MRRPTHIDRRAFVVRNAAMATAAAIPGLSAAATPASASQAALGPMNWATATRAELEPLIGQRFRASSAEAGQLALRLVAVEPVQSGIDRPGHLPRTEGVIAVFDSPDKAPLVDAGHQVFRLSHARLGSADLFIGPVRERNGDHLLELILN